MLDYYLPPRLYLFDYNQLIFICAKADLFGMFNAGSPVCGGKHGSEVVVTFVVCFRKAGIGDHRLGIYCICACNVKSHRVKGGKESHIRNNGCVVFGVAVTVRRYVDHQVNVKAGRPSTTAFVYSAILQFRISLDSSEAATMASFGQTPIHLPQPTHLLWSMEAFCL